MTNFEFTLDIIKKNPGILATDVGKRFMADGRRPGCASTTLLYLFRDGKVRRDPAPGAGTKKTFRYWIADQKPTTPALLSGTKRHAASSDETIVFPAVTASAQSISPVAAGMHLGAQLLELHSIGLDSAAKSATLDAAALLRRFAEAAR